MTFELSQSFSFDAAHTLTRFVPVAEYEASRRIHGHTYTARVAITAPMTENGMLGVPTGNKKFPMRHFDLYSFRADLERVRQMLDHQFLDEVPGLVSGTLESLCVFIASKLPDLPLVWVEVCRASGDCCRLTIQSPEVGRAAGRAGG